MVCPPTRTALPLFIPANVTPAVLLTTSSSENVVPPVGTVTVCAVVPSSVRFAMPPVSVTSLEATTEVVASVPLLVSMPSVFSVPTPFMRPSESIVVAPETVSVSAPTANVALLTAPVPSPTTSTPAVRLSCRVTVPSVTETVAAV